MPELVKIEETVELPHPHAAVWPILARTDWINRAVGLPPVKYEIKPLPEALAATREMHEQLSCVNLKENVRLQLKSGLHSGACLAVNANDRLDFFGSTVNLAARLVAHCEGDDLVLADEIYQRSETQQFLGAIGQTGISGEEKFTGFPNPVKVWRIPVLQK
jgi:class 3 adenylate cyclase